MMKTPMPELRRLSDAVTLHAIRTDSFKTARLSLSFILPADAEKSPLRALFFRGVLMGTAHYPRLSLISRRLDSLYGTTVFTRNMLIGDSQVLSLHFDMMEDAFIPVGDTETDILGGTLALLGDMILHPLTDRNGILTAQTVARDKQVQIDEIRAERNDTRTYAADRLWQLTYAGEPCGLSLLGSVGRIAAVTPEEVTAVWQEMLTAARVEVFYIGRADPDTVAYKWCAAFGRWSPRPTPLPPTLPHIPPAMSRRATEDMPVSQSKLCMSWSGGAVTVPSGAPEQAQGAYVAMLVCNELLGVMQSSLLFRRVREERGLCYSCDSDYNGEKGVLTVSCGMHPDNQSAAEDSIRACVAAVQNGQITEDDVALARLSLTNEYCRIPDSQGGMENFWFRQSLAGTDETPKARIARIGAVTAADVIAAAKRLREDAVFCLHAQGDMGNDPVKCPDRSPDRRSDSGEDGED